MAELEALLAQARRVEVAASRGGRRGLGVLGLLLICLVSGGTGVVGTYQILQRAYPSPDHPALTRRLAVDVHQAERVLQDAELRAEVVDSIGAALAHGSVDCSVEWRTDDGELVTEDRVRGHTNIDGRGLRYRERRPQE